MNVVVWLLVASASTLIALVLRETAARCGHTLAPHIVRFAARRLSPDWRIIREEEWLAIVADFDNRNLPLSALLFGVRVLLGTARMSRPHRRIRAMPRLVVARFSRPDSDVAQISLAMIGASALVSGLVAMGWTLAAAVTSSLGLSSILGMLLTRKHRREMRYYRMLTFKSRMSDK